jgi:hypothetical protein
MCIPSGKLEFLPDMKKWHSALGAEETPKLIETFTINGVTFEKYALAKNMDEQSFKVTYPGSGYYIGRLNDQFKKTGKGIYIWDNGNKYKGEWQDDVRWGKGILIDEKGCHYGNWCNDLKHGQGIFTTNFGVEFSGVWDNDELRSYPVLINYPNKERYQGHISINEKGDILRHGKGCNVWSNDRYYLGEWANNQQHGRGEYVDGNGDKYIGVWQDGKFDTTQSITIIYKNLDRYQGTIDENFSKTGYGKYTWHASGNSYEGPWKNDTMHGRGKIRNLNGKVTKGIWKNGELIKLINSHK